MPATLRLRSIMGLLIAVALATAATRAQAVPLFGTPHAYVAGSETWNMATGDLNGDGIRDMVACNYNAASVSVFLGTLNGSFGPKTDFQVDEHPMSVALGDLNGDGRLDIVTGNYGPGGGLQPSASVLLGNGNGTFAAHTEIPAHSVVWTVLIGDLNGDGKADLVLSEGNGVGVMLGNGNGTFGAIVSYPSGDPGPAYGNLIDIGELNGDGKLDVVVVSAPAKVSVLLGNGAGGFGTATNFATDLYPQSVRVADLNGDGKSDVATVNQFNNSASVLLGNGDGTFGAHTDLGPVDGPVGLAIGDLNADGKVDLATANQNSSTFSVFLGNGNGGFGPSMDFSSAGGIRCVEIVDLNRDGGPDLATVTRGNRAVTVFPTNGSGSFSTQVEYAVGSIPTGVAIADLNGDGFNDLSVSNYLSLSISVLLGDGLGHFGTNTEFESGGRATAVAVGDVNGDGKPDLAASNYETHTVSVLLGNGDGTFQAKSDFGTGGTPMAMAMGDLNGDGKPDLVTANDNADQVAILLNNGDGTFGAHTDFGTGSLPSAVAIGDLNGDGKPDVVTANSSATGGPTGNTASVLLGNGDGTFAPKTNYPVGNNPLSVAIGDVNGDGKPDLVTANQVSAGSQRWTVSVLLGDGSGGFATAIDNDIGSNPVSVALADFNVDGKLDLVTANHGYNTVTTLRGEGNGVFAIRRDYDMGPNPVFVTAGDLNRDGLPDLVTANGGTTISVLLQLGGDPVPTLLARFETVVMSDGIQVRWEFQEPGRVAQVTLDRAANSSGPWSPVALEFHRDGMATEALDKTVTPGQSYWYRLGATLTDGSHAVFGPVQATALSALKASGLTGIVPNPATSNARIDFALVRQQTVRISVVDVAGREAAVLADAAMTPGNYSLLWDGRRGAKKAEPGVYFVSWTSEGRTMNRRLVLLP